MHNELERCKQCGVLTDDLSSHKCIRLGQLGEPIRLGLGGELRIRDTDKLAHDHNFVEIYEKFFFQWKNDPIRILEIGIYTGGSLGLWYDYFQRASIFGIDIEPKTQYENDRTKTFVADQVRRDQLKRFIDTYGGDFDIIIDDGGHAMAQQQVSFGFLFPFVKSGGYYIIEDLHTSLHHLHPSFGASVDDSTLLSIEKFSHATNDFKATHMYQKEESYISDNVDFINLNTRIRGKSNRSITCLFKKK